MTKILIGALKSGLWGLLIGPLVGIAAVFAALIFDPKCGVGDSGGCAMGIVTVPLAVALPSFGLFFVASLVRQLWKHRPADPVAAIKRLRTLGREE